MLTLENNWISYELQYDTTGAQPRLKSWGGTKIWVPTPGRLRPAPGQRPGWVLSAEGGRPLPLWGSGGIIPGKCFENSHAKSCILVTICCKISCFFENYGQEVGGPIHSWSPNFKVGGPVSPGPTVVAPMWYCIFYSTTYCIGIDLTLLLIIESYHVRRM